jgi:hypothetical protein
MFLFSRYFRITKLASVSVQFFVEIKFFSFETTNISQINTSKSPPQINNVDELKSIKNQRTHKSNVLFCTASVPSSIITLATVRIPFGHPPTHHRTQYVLLMSFVISRVVTTEGERGGGDIVN